ncbi:MAG TPA: DUF3108 domain-containing protein [Pseudolabrys sp.]|nr:DUF3108 domain-containing protein [Pseudolabrys sp.]
MMNRRAPTRSSLCKALAVLAVLSGVRAGAAEPVNLVAHYTITMTHVRVGELSWTVNFSDATYLTSANGKASGVLSVLVKGEGSFTTRGVMASPLAPAVARSDINDDDGVYETEMTFESGVLTRVEDRGDTAPPERIPVAKKLLQGVSDPLSAMLIASEQNAMAAANCRRTLKIYDGRRRYNLALSYKRVDKVEMTRGYAGPALVCGVVLQPIGGYKPDSLLVRYLAGKDDLEMWFAPVKGTTYMAPVKALMPTLVGTMEVSADEFFERRAGAAAQKSVEKPAELPAQPMPPAASPSEPAQPAEATSVAPTKPIESAPLGPPKQ